MRPLGFDSQSPQLTFGGGMSGIRQDMQPAIYASRLVRTRNTVWRRHPPGIDGPLGFKHGTRTYTKRGTRLRMKRAFAIAALVAAVAVLTKLTFKPVVPDSSSSSVPIAHSPNSPADREPLLIRTQNPG